MIIVADDSPEDWSAPGVYRVAPGVYRIPMPLPEASRLLAVNVYALVEDTGIVLVDSGWAMQGARDRLAASLAVLGAGIGDVRRFLVTHQHRDHYTLAVEVRREFRTPISVGIGEKDGLELAMVAGRLHLAAQAAGLRRHGAGELADTVLAGQAGVDTSRFWELPDAWLRPPEHIAVAGRTLQALPTPGHTRAHVVFVDGDAQLLFAGDPCAAAHHTVDRVRARCVRPPPARLPRFAPARARAARRPAVAGARARARTRTSAH